MQPSDVAATSEFFQCGNLILSVFQFTPFQFDHDPKRLTQSNNEFLLLERYLSGAGHGIINDAPTAISSQTLHLVDWSRHYRSVTTRVTGQSIMIPHSLVGYDPSRYPAYLSFQAGSTVGSLLCAVLEQFSGAMRASNPDEASLCADLCVSIVRRCLQGRDDVCTQDISESARRALARAYIERNLSDPELSADTICKELKVSRATLYRLFAEEGGVARYIDRLRLERCFEGLRGAPSRRGEVRRIAEAWGFHEASTFNKKFRRHFDMAPIDCLGSNSLEPLDSMGHCRLWPINDWLQSPLISNK